MATQKHFWCPVLLVQHVQRISVRGEAIGGRRKILLHQEYDVRQLQHHQLYTRQLFFIPRKRTTPSHVWLSNLSVQDFVGSNNTGNTVCILQQDCSHAAVSAACWVPVRIDADLTAVGQQYKQSEESTLHRCMMMTALAGLGCRPPGLSWQRARRKPSARSGASIHRHRTTRCVRSRSCGGVMRDQRLHAFSTGWATSSWRAQSLTTRTSPCLSMR